MVLLRDVEARGLDPLALRLAFLEHRYRQQMNLTWDTLAAADAAVRRWRDRVAEWANSPSRPMCAQYVSEFTAALDDDLDTPAALRVLRSLEKDSEVPPGSKFETFAHLDQVLGLDLARDIGKAPAPRPLPPGADELLTVRAAARVGGGLGRGRPDPGRTGRARRHGDRHPAGPDLDRGCALTSRLSSAQRSVVSWSRFATNRRPDATCPHLSGRMQPIAWIC